MLCLGSGRERAGGGGPAQQSVVEKINKVLVVSDTGRGWRDEREIFVWDEDQQYHPTWRT